MQIEILFDVGVIQFCPGFPTAHVERHHWNAPLVLLPPIPPTKSLCYAIKQPSQMYRYPVLIICSKSPVLYMHNTTTITQPIL